MDADDASGALPRVALGRKVLSATFPAAYGAAPGDLGCNRFAPGEVTLLRKASSEPPACSMCSSVDHGRATAWASPCSGSAAWSAGPPPCGPAQPPALPLSRPGVPAALPSRGLPRMRPVAEARRGRDALLRSPPPLVSSSGCDVLALVRLGVRGLAVVDEGARTRGASTSSQGLDTRSRGEAAAAEPPGWERCFAWSSASLSPSSSCNS